MINEAQVRRYCREDLNLIENYYEAVRSEEPYHCHHRYELNDGLVLSVNDLKNMGLYYKRPASELIFLKRIDHHHLHTIGSVHPLYGKHCSEETKEKIRKSTSNEKNHNAKTILQINKETGEVMAEFKCIMTAAKTVKTHKNNISGCLCNRQKTAGGFSWVYATDYQKHISDIKPLF